MTNASNSIEQTYDLHPLNARRILDRVARENVPPSDITEANFCRDEQTEITDQNHIGGAASTMRLARLAKVCGADKVLDLACGLGGPARLLADSYGCFVDGIDLHAGRIADALLLSKMAGLSYCTHFSVADMTSAELPPVYSLVWGQNSWMHVSDPMLVVRTAMTALRPNGRIAFEEVCLAGDADSAVEADSARELERCWQGKLRTKGEWEGHFIASGMRVDQSELADDMLLEYLRKMVKISAMPLLAWPDGERNGIELALELAEKSAISYVRLIARVAS